MTIGTTIKALRRGRDLTQEELAEGLESKIAPKWLSVDKNALSAKVVALPARDDIDFEFEEQLIVELYSK